MTDELKHVVDRADLASGLSVLAHDVTNPPYATCPADDEPLIGTFKYRGVEFVCMVCGAGYGLLSPKPAEPTEALKARLAELEARFEAGDEPGSVLASK